MTHLEANAIRLYCEAVTEAEREGKISYRCKEDVRYYKNSKLTLKEFMAIKEMWGDIGDDEIDAILDYCNKIYEVTSGIYAY